MRHASVFSGIGGPEVAAEMLGWENLFHCEINPFGRAILDYWFPNSESYEDITKTDFSKWRGQVDVLTGGFPCQPFSYAGQRRGSEDDRYLWPYMFRCIDQIRPAWVVAENVAGILTMVEQGEVSQMESQGTLFDEVDRVPGYRLRETFTLQRICDDLEGHGYEVQPVLIPACSVGAPHRRDRVFIVGRRAVADADGGADRRASREDEGKGREERIQERHEVWQPDEPNQVRPTSERNAPADTDMQRCDKSITTSKPSQEERLDRKTHTCWENIANPKSQPGHGYQPQQPESGGAQQEQFRGRGGEDGGRRNAADTSDAGFQETRAEQQAARHWGYGVRTGEWIERFGYGDEIGSRWSNFPTVSPVYRGNDGLPFSLDDLAISAGKWRTESLKAYGNAIVPQVMYEIFRAIEIITEKKQKP